MTKPDTPIQNRALGMAVVGNGGLPTPSTSSTINTQASPDVSLLLIQTSSSNAALLGAVPIRWKTAGTARELQTICPDQFSRHLRACVPILSPADRDLYWDISVAVISNCPYSGVERDFPGRSTSGTAAVDPILLVNLSSDIASDGVANLDCQELSSRVQMIEAILPNIPDPTFEKFLKAICDAYRPRAQELRKKERRLGFTARKRGCKEEDTDADHAPSKRKELLSSPMPIDLNAVVHEKNESTSQTTILKRVGQAVDQLESINTVAENISKMSQSMKQMAESTSKIAEGINNFTKDTKKVVENTGKLAGAVQEKSDEKTLRKAKSATLRARVSNGGRIMGEVMKLATNVHRIHRTYTIWKCKL